MSIILSVDDGAASDTRIANLARKYRIETIFYWPVNWHFMAAEKGYEPLNYWDAQKIAKDFEIGSHTITHRHLTKLPINEAKNEIMYSKYMLEALFGKEVTKFCPPRGYVNDDIDDLIYSYYDSRRLTKGEGLVHIHPDSGANNNKPWRDCIDENTTEIWGHSWEFDKYNLWDELEECLKSIS